MADVYDSAKGKTCPITGNLCQGKSCAWWCRFAEDCAVPLIAGILADSEINRICWEAMKHETDPV